MGLQDLPKSVATAVDKIYTAGFSADLWQEGLSDLCSSLGAYSAVTVPRVAAHNTINLPSTPGMEDFLQAFVRDGWYERDIRAERGWPLVDRGQPVVLEQDIIRPDEHEKHPLYQDLYRRHGMLWWAGITFRTHEQQYVLSLSRSERQEAFSEQERQLFLQLTGHLAQSVTLAEKLCTAAGRGGLEVLDALGNGGILVDARGWVMGANRSAERLLGNGIGIRNRAVYAQSASANRSLQDLLHRCLRLGPQPDAAVVVERPLGRPLLVEVLPIPAEAASPFFFGKVLLLLVDLDKRPTPKSALLASLFNLTVREAALALELGRGASLAEAADSLGITRETARGHLKVVFSKTDTNRQSELIVLVHRAAAISF
ncbi:helix-turn-helix transcriptional regulator [Aquibaculum sediminis]|uniref:helix-turn-helix transcriptional regulator n=1 Tax=Aquibaculum sediminis TaxID=3231907 RepID=UPI003456B04D